jgi:hypothetical protein
MIGAVRRDLFWQVGVLCLGLAAIAVAMLAGRSDPIGAVFSPPPPAALVLGVATGLLAVVLVVRAANRLGTSQVDARALIRAVRLLFLAVGAGAASAGWIIGSPVPVIAGLVIAGIDLLETTFLLLVTGARRSDEPPVT